MRNRIARFLDVARDAQLGASCARPSCSCSTSPASGPALLSRKPLARADADNTWGVLAIVLPRGAADLAVLHAIAAEAAAIARPDVPHSITFARGDRLVRVLFPIPSGRRWKVARRRLKRAAQSVASRLGEGVKTTLGYVYTHEWASVALMLRGSDSIRFNTSPVVRRLSRGAA
jgi:hypothetical protein